MSSPKDLQLTLEKLCVYGMSKECKMDKQVQNVEIFLII